MGSRWWMTGAGVLLALLSGPVARAWAERPRSFALNLVRAAGAESCISSHKLAALAEQWMGPVFVAAGEGEFAIEALLYRDPEQGWRARVVVSERDGALLGVRELRTRDADCHRLDRQLLLVVALAIDPEIAQRGLPDELLQAFPGGDDAAPNLLHELDLGPHAGGDPSAGARSDPANIRARAEPSAEVAVARPGVVADRSVTWSWDLGASLAFGVGLLPRPATGPQIEVGVEPASFWPIVLYAGFWFENDAALAFPTTRGEAIHFNMLQVGAALCPTLLAAGAVRLRACGGLSLVHRTTDSAALEAGIDVTRWSFAPTLGPGFGYALGKSLWLNAGISVQTPLSRDGFTYLDQFGTKHLLFRPAFATLFAQIGLSYRL